MLTFLRKGYWKVIGRDISRFEVEKSETEKLSPQEIEIRQLNKLKSVLIHAKKNVPYYKRKFEEIDFRPEELGSLKDFYDLDFFVDKEDIKKNTKDFISTCANPSDLSWHRTGGSTGTPLYFATDKETDTGSQTSIMRSLKWFGTEFGRKHVIFWGSPGYVVNSKKDIPKAMVNRIRDKLMSRMFISNYDLSEENMLLYYEKIKKFKPEYVRGMSSSLYVFSKFMNENNLKFNGIKVVHSACEQLFPWQKDEIEKAFCTYVANTYGLSEVCDIAYEAPCGGLHISDEDVIVELINTENGKEIVVTQLNNKNSPLIKYRTADLADSITFHECCYKTKIIQGLSGRAHDTIKCRNGKIIHGQAFTHIMVFLSGVRKYQVVQNDFDDFIVLLELENSANIKEIEEFISSGFTRLIGGEVKVGFKYVEKIPLTPAGKHRWIISKI